MALRVFLIHAVHANLHNASVTRIAFVSGASGFVGRAVVRALLARDYRVHALVHSRTLPINDARITFYRGELDDPSTLYPALERVSVAVHLVGIIAEKPSRNVTFHRMHVDFTRAVVDGCVKHDVPRYVHMSALGARPDSPSLYHQTKAAAEAVVQASPLAWTILRPSLIHGPEGDLTRMLAGWARFRKAPWLFMPYFGDGLLGTGRQHLVQPVFVDDVARAFADAAGLPETVGRSFDLAGSQALTWPAMYEHFSRAVVGHARTSLPIPAWYALLLTRVLPASLLPFNRAQVLMSQEDSTADVEPFASSFRFRPASFDESLTTYAAAIP